MLKVLDARRSQVGGFKTYRGFRDFIEKREWLWGFKLYTPGSLVLACQQKPVERVTLSECKALEQGYGLVEIRYGSNRPMRQLIVYPDVCVEDLLRSWCQAYAAEQGYLIFESSVGTAFSRNHRHKVFPVTRQVLRKADLTRIPSGGA